MTSPPDQNSQQPSSQLEELKNMLAELQADAPLGSGLRLFSAANRRRILQQDTRPKVATARQMERHIQSVYRSEVAGLFEKACRNLLFGGGLAPLLIDDGSPNFGAMSQADWAALAQRNLNVIPEGSLEDAPLETVRLMLASPWPTLTEVATIGATLLPLPAFDIYLGLAAIERDQLTEAKDIFLRVHETSPLRNSCFEAADNLASIAALQDNYSEAADWSRLASFSDEPWSHSAMNWLFNAVRCGDAEGANEAAAALGDGPATPAVIRGYCTRIRSNRMSGEWQPDRIATQLGAKALPTTNEATTHILNLFR